MYRSLLGSLLAVVLLCLTAATAVGQDSSDRLDDAKASLVQLAAWFESLPPIERAEAARELRRWLTETYGGEVPFPFALPSEEEIASWETTPPEETPQQAAVEVEPAEADPPPAPAAPAAPAPVEEVKQATTPLPKTPTPAPPPSPPAPGRCNTLVPFDTDGDSTLTGRDRHWRHFYLWFDSDGDRKPADGEMVSPFEYKIREVGLDLRYFVAGRGKKASRGEIELDEFILFDAKQDGFRATVYPAADDAALAVDADALRRDSKGLDLRDADGTELTGIQPFVAGWTITDRDGASVAVDCPG